MAAEIFVDTSAWYPIAVASHPDHKWLADALTAAVRGGRRVVTTNLIVAETYALLLSRAGQPAALGFLRAVKQSPNEVVSSTPELEDRAITRLEDNPLKHYYPDLDLDYSFTDAVSREVIAERGIHEVLTLGDFNFLGGVVVRAVGRAP